MVGRGLYRLNPCLPRTNEGVGIRGWVSWMAVNNSIWRVVTVDKSIVREGLRVISAAVLGLASGSCPSLLPLPPDAISPSAENNLDNLNPPLLSLLINFDPFFPLVFHQLSNFKVPFDLTGPVVMYFLETGFPTRLSLFGILLGYSASSSSSPDPEPDWLRLERAATEGKCLIDGRELEVRIDTSLSVVLSVSVSIGGDSRSSVPEDEAEVLKVRESDWELELEDGISFPALTLVEGRLWAGRGTAVEFRLVGRGRGRELGEGPGLIWFRAVIE